MRSVLSLRHFSAKCSSKLVHLNLKCAGVELEGCRNFHQSCSLMKSGRFVRTVQRVYVPPDDGIIPARQSLAELPKGDKQAENVQQQSKSKTSAEIFKKVMGEILATRSKRLIAVEGARIVDDAIKFGLRPKMLFISKSLEILPENVKKIIKSQSEGTGFETDSSRPEIHRLSHTAMQEWSSVQTPPGIIGVFDRPAKPVQVKNSKLLLPLTVVLDNIREPGNLGSIIRTAAGIGCKVILSEGCADHWETKSLRGGNGGQFLIPIKAKVNLEYLHQYISFVDETDCTQQKITSADSGEITNSTDKRGIGVFLADVGSDPDDLGIPIVDYTSVQYSKFRSIYLILGGETSGLSKVARKAVIELPQYYPDDVKLVSRIRIPMCLPIDSLNVANSFGIIGYEILRQLGPTASSG